MPAYTTLIEASELAAFIQDAPAQLLVCDCRFDLTDFTAGRTAHAAGHIPGAVYLSLEDDLSGPKTGQNGRHPLPDRAAFAAQLASLGATPNTQIVAYDAGDAMVAARLWWLLRWLGHENAAVLNGGLAAWRQSGFTIETTTAPPWPRSTFTPRPALVSTIDYATLRATPAGEKLLLDARAPDRFRGENETLDPTGGHIPGARNRFFRDNLDPQNRFKPAATLHAEYLRVLTGTPPNATTVSCGSGVTACHDILAMHIAGLPGAALYPGSWSEWSAQPNAPIARGK